MIKFLSISDTSTSPCVRVVYKMSVQRRVDQGGSRGSIVRVTSWIKIGQYLMEPGLWRYRRKRIGCIALPALAQTVMVFDWLIGKHETFSLVNSWCLRNKVKPLYREKTVYIKNHKAAINRPVDHKGSCFFYWNPFIFVGYRNDRFFPIQILIFRMLRNNADVRRCSYFELGLPVIFPKLSSQNMRGFGHATTLIPSFHRSPLGTPGSMTHLSCPE